MAIYHLLVAYKPVLCDLHRSFKYSMKICSWNHVENINWSRSGSELQVLSKAPEPQKWWKGRKFTYFTQFRWVKWPKIGSIAWKASKHIIYWLINLKRSKFKSKQGKWVLTTAIYWKLRLVNRPCVNIILDSLSTLIL